jgi:hypothetical protein
MHCELSEFAAICERRPPHIYCHATIACRLFTDFVHDAVWADHYFQHYFDETQSHIQDGTEYTIYCGADDTLLTNALGTIKTLAANKIGSHHYQYDHRYSISESLVAYHNPDEALMIVHDSDGRTFWIFGSTNASELRFESSRVIREIVTRELESSGQILIHAAAVERDGQAILLCGHKGAGKTTTMLSLLQRGYNLIANDRVFVGRSDIGWIASGWPGAVALTLQTRDFFPELMRAASDLSQLRFPQYRLGIHDVNGQPHKFRRNDQARKLDMTPVEAAAAFGAAVVNKVPIKNVIILNRESKHFSCSPMVPDEAFEAITKEMLSPVDPSYSNRFNLHAKAIKVEDVITALQSFTREVHAHKFDGDMSVADKANAIEQVIGKTQWL